MTRVIGFPRVTWTIYVKVGSEGAKGQRGREVSGVTEDKDSSTQKTLHLVSNAVKERVMREHCKAPCVCSSCRRGNVSGRGDVHQQRASRDAGRGGTVSLE